MNNSITIAPAESEYYSVLGLADVIQRLNRKDRETQLLKGLIYIMLKQQYRQYSRKLYKSGFKKEEIPNYNTFKASFGFGFDSASWISNLTRVSSVYVIEYGMAEYELLWRKDNPDHQWERDETLRIKFSYINPLLTATPFEMLLYLIKGEFHNTKKRAVEILEVASNSKRSDFWLWLEQQRRVTPIVINPALVDECDPHDKPYQNSLQEVCEGYQLAAPEFWKEIAKRMAIPTDIRRPLRLTITIDEIEYGSGNNARSV